MNPFRDFNELKFIVIMILILTNLGNLGIGFQCDTFYSILRSCLYAFSCYDELKH